MNMINSYTNSETGMTAFVFYSDFGGYGVSMRDDYSGEFMLASSHGIKSLDDAISKAQVLVDL